MAAPRGDLLRNLNAGFSDFAAAEAIREAQDGFERVFERSHNPGFDHDYDITSSNLHGSLEPSILSMFEDMSPTGEVKNRIDEESEATLLSALSEILDSVIEDTLSPFDTLPDTELFVAQRSHDSKFRRSSDKEAAPRVARSQRSSTTNSKAESLLSDRQLRPRLHQRIKTTTVQRSDGEEEDLSETRRRPVRTFRIESDPELSQDEQQDGYMLVSLVDLVRHMHPYSLRVGLVKEDGSRAVCDLQEEDVFVDVVGDDDLEDTLSTFSQHNLDSELISKTKMGLNEDSSMKRPKDQTLKMCSSLSEQNKDDINSKILQKSAGRVKKKVSFAPELATVYEYQDEDEASEFDCPDAQCPEDHKDTAETSVDHSLKAATKTTSQQSNAKPKSISLHEYRLLRQKSLPKEEKKMDYRTKWPSVPENPSELPLIPCIPGYIPPQDNAKTSFHKSRNSSSSSVTKAKRNPQTSHKSPTKQNIVQAVDPPNPVIVPLPVSIPVPAKTSSASEDQSTIMQQKTDTNNANANQPTLLNPQLQPPASHTSGILKQSDSLSQETLESAPLAEVTQAKCSSTVTDATKANVSAASLPVRGRPAKRRLPQVQIPTITEEASQESNGEIGIQAADVTSLLEQFETQGLTPPATPPHQIWKPLLPGHRTKQHEAIKQSASKAIQIIEPRPLPPSKGHLRPQPSTSVPAPSLFLAFRDHDYCITQEDKESSDRSLSAISLHRKPVKEPRSQTSHTSLDHRTVCEEQRLPASVLLSPESSPCRQEESMSAGEEAVAQRETSTPCSSRSPSPPARGRTRRRRYRERYHHSDSSSVSSSRSPSCSSSASSSSSSSCSPPRKRRRSRSSDSSSSSSSRSSSSSLSPSPIRKRQRRYTRSSRPYSDSCYRSRSRSRSRLGSSSRSPQSAWRNKWNRHRERSYLSGWEEARRMRKQKAIEERRVVYVGRIRATMTEDELRDRFVMFGKIEDCTVHLRSRGDNYAFVTYYRKDDAFTAIENGTKLRRPDELPFDICFGGRRQFCQSNYADLDSSRETDSTSGRKFDALDFDALLKQAQRGAKR
ncbi:peroxisome proliferator-activated receptor gamma coactivator-related protein 1-like [Astyanax mexicanus]|uniref:Peroxisome proliferator-activated receptor gamma coactivator-related protein 1-like n=1 Tax=Astyanax mexicanus TaxID=7994 RepID=A0A8T2L5M9_ASTMX|nr:peroxisome proliferator-activated receptor gamma coactivator-related protein 1-like [Astyanax mexicanus]